MRRLPLAAAAAASLACAPAQAGTAHDERLWVNLTAMGALGGDVLYFVEAQPRLGDGASRLDQLLLRGAVGLKLGRRVSLSQGYAHVVNPVDGGRDINEERSFQQLAWTIGPVVEGKGELSSRTRLEQRWRSDGHDTGWRLREMVRYEAPLARRAGPNALVYAELFVALNDTDWGARGGFDQLRGFAGLEIPIGGASTVEAGYLNQTVDRAGGRRQVNHVLSMSLFYRP